MRIANFVCTALAGLVSADLDGAKIDTLLQQEATAAQAVIGLQRQQQSPDAGGLVTTPRDFARSIRMRSRIRVPDPASEQAEADALLADADDLLAEETRDEQEVDRLQLKDRVSKWSNRRYGLSTDYTPPNRMGQKAVDASGHAIAITIIAAAVFLGITYKGITTAMAHSVQTDIGKTRKYRSLQENPGMGDVEVSEGEIGTLLPPANIKAPISAKQMPPLAKTPGSADRDTDAAGQRKVEDYRVQGSGPDARADDSEQRPPQKTSV